MTSAATTKTTMTKGNRKLSFTIASSDPIDELQRRIDLAQGHHLATKKSAMEAVAHACVYSGMVAADTDLQKWEKERIEEMNTQIKEHNEGLKKDRKRAEDFVFGRLDKEDRVFVAKTEEDKKAANEEKVQLKAVAARTDGEWKALRKVEIKARNGASDNTATVKLVFALDKVTDAPTVSRYSLAMDWVYETFGSDFPNTHEPIIQAIEAAHGFEAVLAAQRAKKNPKAPKSANDNADEKAAEKYEEAVKIREKLKDEAAKATVKVHLENAEGLAIVLGRYSQGRLEIVRSFTLSPEELDDLLTRYAADAAHED
jgi:hypothetical protein